MAGTIGAEALKTNENSGRLRSAAAGEGRGERRRTGRVLRRPANNSRRANRDRNTRARRVNPLRYLALGCLIGCTAVFRVGGAPAQTAPVFAGPFRAGELGAPPRNEASGLAASRRTPDLLWIHDDSGGQAALFGVGLDGALRGRLPIRSAKNDDWEDLAAAEFDGRAWLLIANTGDNLARRSHVSLLLVPEPAPHQFEATPAAATLRITYEDGPRDCESVAIDAAERSVYLLSKRDLPPRLYRVDMPAPLGNADLKARFLGLVTHLPGPTVAQAALKGHLGKHRAEPCAMDFASDGYAAVILTYGDVLLFPRQPNESWTAALQRVPVRLAEHGLPQAEAVCFSPDGRHIFVASESSRTLLRYDRR
jgi:hypothetical protein